MTATADQVIAVAASQIGYYKTPGTATKFGQWYGLPTGQWCAMFQSWCADQAGALDIIPKHAYTPSGAAWFQAHGQWHSGTAGMKRGDIVYFDFPGAPVRISHVGIVESGSGPWNTIEGNTSGVSGGSQRNGGLVARKTRSAYIAGYGRPAYAGAPSPVVSTPSPIQIVGSLAVLALQRLLNAHGYTLAEDGIDGPATNGATVDYQSKHGLDPDGVAGPLTLGSLKGVAPAKPPRPGVPAKKPSRPGVPAPPFPLPRGSYFGPKSGPKQSVSGYYSHREDFRRWQQRMHDRGWVITPDGHYGPQSAGVARDFQMEKHLVVDHLIGSQTWSAAWTAPIT